MKTPTAETLTQTLPIVNPLDPGTVRHHKENRYGYKKIMSYVLIKRERHYGVSSSYRVLTKGVFNKRFDQVQHCLRDVVGLPLCESEATLVLLRFWAHYGKVYPKAELCCSRPGCSKATFWRAVRRLKDLGLIQTIPRFVIREHAQISNLYLLHNLIVVIARYLAEHGAHNYPKWVMPFIIMPAAKFWGEWVRTLGDTVGPGQPAGVILDAVWD